MPTNKYRETDRNRESPPGNCPRKEWSVDAKAVRQRSGEQQDHGIISEYLFTR